MTAQQTEYIIALLEKILQQLSELPKARPPGSGFL